MSIIVRGFSQNNVLVRGFASGIFENIVVKVVWAMVKMSKILNLKS